MADWLLGVDCTALQQLVHDSVADALPARGGAGDRPALRDLRTIGRAQREATHTRTGILRRGRTTGALPDPPKRSCKLSRFVNPKWLVEGEADGGSRRDLVHRHAWCAGDSGRKPSSIEELDADRATQADGVRTTFSMESGQASLVRSRRAPSVARTRHRRDARRSIACHKARIGLHPARGRCARFGEPRS